MKYSAWNKGKTKHSDPRIAAYAVKNQANCNAIREACESKYLAHPKRCRYCKTDIPYDKRSQMPSGVIGNTPCFERGDLLVRTQAGQDSMIGGIWV